MTIAGVTENMDIADCCDQRWAVRVVKTDGESRTLTLCLHHWMERSKALFMDGWTIDEDRSHELHKR